MRHKFLLLWLVIGLGEATIVFAVWWTQGIWPEFCSMLYEYARGGDFWPVFLWSLAHGVPVFIMLAPVIYAVASHLPEAMLSIFHEEQETDEHVIEAE